MSADTAVSEAITHAYGKRARRSVRLNHSKISADPLFPTQNVRPSLSISVIFDAPLNGYTVTEVKAVWDGFAAQLAATSGAMVTQILGGQN